MLRELHVGYLVSPESIAVTDRPFGSVKGSNNHEADLDHRVRGSRRHAYSGVQWRRRIDHSVNGTRVRRIFIISAAAQQATTDDGCSVLSDDEVAAVIGTPVTRREASAKTAGSFGCVKGNDRATDLTQAAFVSFSAFTTGGAALLATARGRRSSVCRSRLAPTPCTRSRTSSTTRLIA